MLKTILTSLISAFLLITSGHAQSLSNTGLKENIDYIEITPKQSFQLHKEQSLPVVINFFWYGCPHCYKIDPMFKELSKKYKGKALFVHYPVSFPNWETGSNIFFTLESLNLLDKYHDLVFNQIHVNGEKLHTNQSLFFDFMEKNGANKKTIENAFNSFSVKANLEKSKKTFLEYQVQSTPSFAIQTKNNTYLVEPSKVRSYEKTIQNVEAILTETLNNKR